MSNSKSQIRAALESLEKGDITKLKASIKETLLKKVKSRLDEKEKEVAKQYFTNLDRSKE